MHRILPQPTSSDESRHKHTLFVNIGLYTSPGAMTAGVSNILGGAHKRLPSKQCPVAKPLLTVTPVMLAYEGPHIFEAAKRFALCPFPTSTHCPTQPGNSGIFLTSMETTKMGRYHLQHLLYQLLY